MMVLPNTAEICVYMCVCVCVGVCVCVCVCVRGVRGVLQSMMKHKEER